MGHYTMKFDEVLLPGWESWDTGNYYLPAKTVTFINGSTGSVIVDTEGASVYGVSLDELADTEDMGEEFVDNEENPTLDTSVLCGMLNESDIDEIKQVFIKYAQHQDSYVSE